MNGKISRVVLFGFEKKGSAAVATSAQRHQRISHVYILIASPQNVTIKKFMHACMC
jgi:hypothetical protein